MLCKIDSHAVTDCLQHSHAGLFESLTPMSPVYMGSFKLLTDQCHTDYLPIHSLLYFWQVCLYHWLQCHLRLCGRIYLVPFKLLADVNVT